MRDRERYLGFTSKMKLTFGANAQGGLVGSPCQLPPEFLDRGLHFILVPREFAKRQDLHVGQRLIWDGRGDRTVKQGCSQQGWQAGGAGAGNQAASSRGKASTACGAPLSLSTPLSLASPEGSL